MKLNTLTDRKLLKSLRELREAAERGKQNYSMVKNGEVYFVRFDTSEPPETRRNRRNQQRD